MHLCLRPSALVNGCRFVVLGDADGQGNFDQSMLLTKGILLGCKIYLLIRYGLFCLKSSI
jgi:hypothetical protein